MKPINPFFSENRCLLIQIAPSELAFTPNSFGLKANKPSDLQDPLDPLDHFSLLNYRRVYSEDPASRQDAVNFEHNAG